MSLREYIVNQLFNYFNYEIGKSVINIWVDGYLTDGCINNVNNCLLDTEKVKRYLDYICFDSVSHDMLVDNCSYDRWRKYCDICK